MSHEETPTRATRRTYPEPEYADPLKNSSSGPACLCTGSPTPLELVKRSLKGEQTLKCPACHELHNSAGQKLGLKDMPAGNPLTI